MFKSVGTSTTAVQVLIVAYLILLFVDEDLQQPIAPRSLDSPLPVAIASAAATATASSTAPTSSSTAAHLRRRSRLFASAAHVFEQRVQESRDGVSQRPPFGRNESSAAAALAAADSERLRASEGGRRLARAEQQNNNHALPSDPRPAPLVVPRAQRSAHDSDRYLLRQASQPPETGRRLSAENEASPGERLGTPGATDPGDEASFSELNLKQLLNERRQQKHSSGPASGALNNELDAGRGRWAWPRPVNTTGSSMTAAGAAAAASHQLQLGLRHRRMVAMDEADCGEVLTSRKPAIFGLRCDDSEVTKEGSIIVKAFKATKIYLIGRNLYSNLTVALTEMDGAVQDDCTHVDRIKSLPLYNISMNVGRITVELPPPEKKVPYYFCVRENTPDARWYHQGSASWLRISVEKDYMPLWAKVLSIAVLLSMSGLFSGLNLGLMALDKNELQVIMKCGTEDEKRYATAIEPVRRRGNYLLCSILFSNTLVNSTISVLLEDLSSGMVAVVMSTVLIVLFGEILPQAFCSRHGLAVGARTIWLTHFCMFVTFPMSYPVSYCLDWALGEEIGHAYDRERLMEFIQVTRDVNNLGADEVNIIAGALKIKRTKVSEVMTKIEDVYMIDEEAVLDFETIQAIAAKGYSRIPVHELGNKHEIKAVLFAKDLALVDPDDKTPVQTMTSFYNHPVYHVDDDKTLDFLLSYFKKGESHMAFVRGFVDNTELDPFKGVIGVITLEDVIEEIMQMEINDETDILSDNKWKKRRKDAQVRRDFSQFTNLGTGDSSYNVVTPQLCLAAYQYLATTVEPFTKEFLTDQVLRRLLSQKIFYKVRVEDEASMRRLYTAGEPADYFIMILEGRVHVICGKEDLVFDGGPFSFFGKAALMQTDQPGDDSSGSTAVIAATAPAAATLSAATGGARRDSTRPPTLSRRESLAKIMASQLSLSGKGRQALLSADQEQQQQQQGNAAPPATAELSPRSQTAKQEAVELAERGVYCFKPDYTVDIIANTSYLKVARGDYITALKASQLEKREVARAPEGGDDGAGLGVGLGGNVETTFIFDNLSPVDFSNHDQTDDNNP